MCGEFHLVVFSCCEVRSGGAAGGVLRGLSERRSAAGEERGLVVCPVSDLAPFPNGKRFLAGEFVQPTRPSVSGFGPEHNSPTAAVPVPSAPGPVLLLSAAPTGPRAQPVEDQRWPNTQPDEQYENPENF